MYVFDFAFLFYSIIYSPLKYWLTCVCCMQESSFPFPAEFNNIVTLFDFDESWRSPWRFLRKKTAKQIKLVSSLLLQCKQIQFSLYIIYFSLKFV